MIVPLTLAAAYALGVDPRRLLLLAAAVYLPAVVGALVVVVVWRSRSDEDDRPASFCDGVASELRAGATVRTAVVTAAASVGSHIPALVPLTEVARRVGDEFPELRSELTLTILGAARSGSDAAALFDEIGSLALSRSEIRREVRMAVAPGRATAFLLGGVPLVYLVGRAASGSLAGTLATPLQRGAAMTGLAVFGLGLVLTVVIVWRSGR